MPQALYTVSEIREIERESLASLPPGTLMQRAGKATARAALGLLHASPADARVLVLAGPGNNGGDALEAAASLAENGVDVTVLLCADSGRLPADACRALQRARSGNVRFADASTESVQSGAWTLAIDGLFGIGLARPVSGLHRTLADAINALCCPVLAIDVPSGLDADTGGIVGDDGIAVRATHTITFIADKPGLHTLDGRDHAGEVTVCDLDIDARHFRPARMHLNDPALFAACLKKRPHNSHKGSYGDVIVVGGAQGMAGAPLLAAQAAAKCGAGRVYAAFIGDAPTHDSMHPELMCRSAADFDLSAATLVAGPGMGTGRLAGDMLARLLAAPAPLVLDADALNLIAAEPGLQHPLRTRGGGTVMTPHPLEAARLLQSSTKEVQSDRLAAAARIAQRFGAVVVLKGSGSVVARPDGTAVINPTGNPALATAGTGDVLAGICGALLAQSFPTWEAAIAAVWLHGKAADVLVEQGIGPIGLTAGELIPCVRTILNSVTKQYAR
ncbi:MAG TPA: NAD(P)H-hydrate dehydratase [Noviherbaspirillum sp.]|uniref:NAD(P)H-hydrate dehydratase n=1 Tax=Noviherbaspirillum sp. TaxID=1926288 RepID=UPI002D63D20B|nr:NAD(P)H-hydrate dehydratase [Noviherbaspirillum sp.]HYD97353.1 NAD(P)H-hydrate dehydratase [Noviherbaspirillum sp.]